MPKKVKVPLKMANGTLVRTMEELKVNFDLVSVLGYYDNGRLVEWLNGLYYEEEAEKISKLSGDDKDFKKELCEILGVEYQADESDAVDLSDIAELNKRRDKLRVITADPDVLEAADRVAFTQEDLADLLDNDVKEIYLYGDGFKIPGSKEGVAYIGIDNPKVDAPTEFFNKGITFKGVNLGIEDVISQAKNATDPEEAAKLWRMAAEQGNADAQYKLGVAYFYGDFVEFEDIVNSHTWANSAILRKPSKTIYSGTAYDFGEELAIDKKEAVKWYRKAAEQGNAYAQYSLGVTYDFGEGVAGDRKEAIKWYRKAAKQGNAHGQYNLGVAYDLGEGVAIDRKEAIKWYRKAAEQGNKEAKRRLEAVNAQTETLKPQHKSPENTVAIIGPPKHGKTTLAAAITKVLFQKYGFGESLSPKQVSANPIMGYKSPKSTYKLYDIPGEEIKEFTTTSASVIIIVMSAANNENEVELLRELAKILDTFDWLSVVIFLNKCDVNDDDELLDLMEMEIELLLTEYGYPFGQELQLIRGSASKAIEEPNGKWGDKIINLVDKVDSLSY